MLAIIVILCIAVIILLIAAFVTTIVWINVKEAIHLHTVAKRCNRNTEKRLMEVLSENENLKEELDRRWQTIDFLKESVRELKDERQG